MALTLVIQTVLTVVLGAATVWEALWQRQISPLAACSAPRWLRGILAGSSTVSVSASGLAHEGCRCMLQRVPR